MATERLTIVVDERGARVVKRNIASIGQGARGAEGGVQLLRRALGALAAAASIRQIVSLGDEFQRLENRVRVALDGQGDYNEVLDNLFGIAQRTRGPVEDLVSLYQRASIAAGELGASQEELLQFTETVGRGLAIQGGAAAESAGALRQLSQSLGSGIVRAEEFNSILEGAFPIALAAARGIERTGGSVAKLRQEVVEGRVTSDEFFRAILSQSDELERQFGQTQVTIGQAFTQLRNSLVQTIGGFSQATGAGEGLATAIQSVAEFVSEAAPAINSLGRAITGTLTPQDELTSGMKVFATIVIATIAAVRQLADILITTVSTAFSAVGTQIGGVAAAIGAALSGEFGRAGEILAESFSDTSDIVVEGATALREDLISNTTDTIDQLVQVWDEGARLTAEAQQRVFNPPDQPDAGGGGGGGVVDEIDRATKNLIESQEELLASLQLEQQALEQVAGTGQDYNVVLEDLETRAIGAETGQQSLAEAIVRTRDTVRELREEQERYNEIQAEGAALTEELRTPTEAFQATLSRLQVLLSEGAIEAETYARAVRQALDELADAENTSDAEDNLKDFFTRARENAQDILGDALADAFTGGLEDIPAQFARVLVQLSSQFFASEIFSALGNLGQGGSGSGFNGFLQSVGGFFAGNFNTGGQFTVPGSGGADSVPTLMNLTPRETVTITPAGQPQTAAAPNVQVAAPPVVVVDSEEKARQYLNGPGGEQAVLKILARNPDAVRRIST